MGVSGASNRRGFCARVIWALWGLISTALAVPAGLYLLVPAKGKQEEEWVESADISIIATDRPEEVIFRRTRKDGWRIISEKATAWVVRLADKDVVAYAPQCTHLGCAYHWDEKSGNFLCPCHTSTFGLDGKVLTGPAPRPLDRYQTRIVDNKLHIGALVESRET